MSFDIVFSKDAIVHIPDKHTLMQDVFRVLKPDGWFTASDWLIGHDGPPSRGNARLYRSPKVLISAWPRRNAIAMRWRKPDSPISASTAAMPGIARRRGKNLPPCRDRSTQSSVERLGKDFVDHNIEIWTKMLVVLDSGEHCPTHVRGRKPA